MKFQPLEDRILIRPFKTAEEKTDGGLYVPVNVKKDVLKGEVYAAGAGVFARESGVFMPTVISEGDVVLFGAETGMELPVDTDNGKEDMRLIREGDILILVGRVSKNS